MGKSKNVCNATVKQIIFVKDSFSNLGKRLSIFNLGLKKYWSILNKLINKKNIFNIPPLLENVENASFIASIQEKAKVLNDYLAEQCCTVSTTSTLPDPSGLMPYSTTQSSHRQSLSP